MNIYRKRANGILTSKAELLEEFKHLSLPVVWTAQTHNALQVDPVYDSEKPQPNDYEIVVAGEVVFQGGKYIRLWSVQPMFTEYTDSDGVIHTVADQIAEYEAEKLLAKRQVMVVTMRQARLALLQVGKLADVEAAIAGMTEPDKSQVSIEWEYASTVERLSPWVAALAPALQMTETELDQLFEIAEGL